MGTAPPIKKTGNNVQVNFFDPGPLLGNVGLRARMDRTYRGSRSGRLPSSPCSLRGLTAQGGASWNSSKQTNSPSLIANNPALLLDPATKAEFGQPNPQRAEIRMVRPAVPRPIRRRCSSICVCATNGNSTTTIPSCKPAARIPAIHSHSPEANPPLSAGSNVSTTSAAI